MKTQQMSAANTRLPARAASRAGGMLAPLAPRRDAGTIHPLAAGLGILCAATVFGLLWLLFSFG